MEELTENAEEGDEEDKQSEQKLGRLNFKVSFFYIPIPIPILKTVAETQLCKCPVNTITLLIPNTNQPNTRYC